MEQNRTRRERENVHSVCTWTRHLVQRISRNISRNTIKPHRMMLSFHYCPDFCSHIILCCRNYEQRIIFSQYLIYYNCSICPADRWVFAESWLVCKFHLPSPYYTHVIFSKGLLIAISCRVRTRYIIPTRECGAQTYTRDSYFTRIHDFCTYIFMCVVYVPIYYEYIVIVNVVRCL